MHKLCLLALLLAICTASIFIAPSASAIDEYMPGEVVISQIYVGATGDATQEFVSIYNNSNRDIDISNWCISSKNNILLACFSPTELDTLLILQSHTYATISSDSFATQNIYEPDAKYQTINNQYGSIIASSDNLSLFDSQDRIINNVCWPKSESCHLPVLSSGNVWQRQQDNITPGQLLDTNTEIDFEKNNILIIPPSDIEERVIVDVCWNIDGVQESAPDGYLVDNFKNCNPPPIDVCQNIEGIQISPPVATRINDNGDCQSDVCLNIDDFQFTMPEGYKESADGNCILDLLPLNITELLPDAIGSDDGNEFIEIYNPNNTDVDLKYYTLDVGLNYERSYNFPINSVIADGQYLKFTNDDIKFTLLNSSSRVRIKAIDNSFIYESSIYNNPISGESWALINDIWQFTNQPTPGGVNLPSVIEQVNVIISKSKLVPCKDGQYRNEETNRCRNIATDIASLVPCAEGQERNPATNRCRSTSAILSASDLKPCDIGQERNPETNRCRNVASMPAADFKPEQVNENSNNDILYWSIGIIGLVAVGYGVWEWRVELLRFWQRLLKRK